MSSKIKWILIAACLFTLSISSGAYSETVLGDSVFELFMYRGYTEYEWWWFDMRDSLDIDVIAAAPMTSDHVDSAAGFRNKFPLKSVSIENALMMNQY